jgi:hypothetical protein
LVNSSSNNEETAASDEKKEDPFTASFGSIQRSEQLLGYKPRVTLKEGIVQLLAWHYDRAYPYGGGPTLAHEKSNFIASKGIVSCLFEMGWIQLTREDLLSVMLLDKMLLLWPSARILDDSRNLIDPSS